MSDVVIPPWNPGDKAMKNPIYIISWMETDRSAFGIVRVYKHKERAEKDFEMLKQFGSRSFNLDEHEVEQ